MQLTKIAGVLLALLMVTGTAAALPGAPVAQADENTDDTNEPERTGADDAERGTDRGGAADDTERGPPADLPSGVPDFVGDLHDRIGQFHDGDLTGSLGETLSDLTPGDEDAQSDGEDTDGDEKPTTTPTAQADA